MTSLWFVLAILGALCQLGLNIYLSVQIAILKTQLAQDTD